MGEFPHTSYTQVLKALLIIIQFVSLRELAHTNRAIRLAQHSDHQTATSVSRPTPGNSNGIMICFIRTQRGKVR